MQLKSLTLTAITLATFALTTSPVFAEDAPQPPPHGEEGGPGGPPPEDGKGGPRSGEFEKRGKEMFEKTDTNKDGFLSKDEMEANQKSRLDEMFQKTDTDNDGKLSPEELKKGREAMREKFRAKFKERQEHKQDKPDDKPSE